MSATLLTAPERDKAVLCLRDIKGLLEHGQHKPGYEELTELQCILESRGLHIAAIPKPEPLKLTPATPAPKPAGPVFSPQAVATIETFVQMYRSFKSQAQKGYVIKNETLGTLLTVVCPAAGIPFSK